MITIKIQFPRTEPHTEAEARVQDFEAHLVGAGTGRSPGEYFDYQGGRGLTHRYTIAECSDERIAQIRREAAQVGARVREVRRG